MKGLLVVLVFALLTFLTSQANNCKYSDIVAIEDGINKYIANFTDPNFAPGDSFDTESEKIITAATPCFEYMRTLATFSNVGVPRVTDECVYDPTDAEWKTDPCCNPELQLTQCCTTRTLNETEERVKTFTNANTACGSPTSAKPLISEFFSSFSKRINRCDTLLKLAEGSVNKLEKKMIACFAIFDRPPRCASDADCYGGKCDARKKKCTFPKGTEDPNPVLNCIFDQVPETTVRNIRTKFGFKATTPIAQVQAAFKSATIGQECQNINGVPLNKNQTECLATKQCNLPIQNCNGGGKCALCDVRGICDFIIPELTTNKTCTESGLCLGGGPSPAPGQVWTKATCENGTQKYCTVYDKCNEDNQCNAAKCAAVGECVGFPFENSTCVFPHDYNNKTQSIFCRAGRTFYDEGCEDKSAAYDTNAKCTAAKGTWYKLPTTKAECESYKACFDNEEKVFISLPQAECTKCKLTTQSRYKWNAGQWINSIFLQEQKWVVPAQVPVNRYINAINGARLEKIALTILNFQLAPAQKSYLQCAFNPVVALFKSVSCDCGTSKGPNGTCYPAPKPVEVGTTRAFAGINTQLKDPSVQVVVPNNTISTAKDVDAIVVSRLANPDIHKQADLSNYYDMFNIHFLNQADAVQGVAVSSGFAVKTASGNALAAPVKLCIKRDKKVTVGAAYTVAAFATKDGSGNLVKSSVTLIGTDFSNEMCANVQSSGTYYAAFFTTGASTSPSTSPKKSPTNPPASSAGTFFLAALAVFFSVLGYLF